eukprot:TRINITY_DN47618_c0_g1_i1.p1 TRINITY_DN47618_c0_g1~~TRINITY_DN47618_c0_g1_i1.p1  ORF type:complete len:262 (+),score=83.23 TRINITY_DN47618_c0_g1_i1:87-788(+)
MPVHLGQHHNQTAWVPHKHQKQLRQAVTERLAGYTDNCCERCIAQLEWRKKYGKYKPLERPGKCHACQERNVVRAYHGLCEGCARSRTACAKCEGRLVPDDATKIADEEAQKEAALREQIQGLPERYRRSAARRLQRGEALVDVQAVIDKGLRRKAVREQSRAAGQADCGGSSSGQSSGDDEPAPAAAAAARRRSRDRDAPAAAAPAARRPAGARAAQGAEDSDSDVEIDSDE